MVLTGLPAEGPIEGAEGYWERWALRGQKRNKNKDKDSVECPRL